ncbi:hypothetical protein AB0J03_08815 [Streptomyces microflavus]|uniref:hypothetical protein n=1 Tax=Streptomyces microflavus TaxID=1919 RepID=UPI0033E2FA24
MGAIKNGAIGSAVVFSVISVLSAGSAFAETPISTASDSPVAIGTAPPAEPEESDLIEVSDPESEPTFKPEKPPIDTPDGVYCSPKNVYKPKTKGTTYHVGVGPTNANYNGTSRVARSTFTSEVTGEVGVSVTAGLSGSVGAMVAEIEAKYDVELSLKMTAKLGNSIAVDTPPKRTTNGRYGVYRLKNTGVSYRLYSNCKTSESKTITSYTPIKVGWTLWES